MFTAYRKSLNDMVFSTSESPEDQPSPGILGRIGYWLSPWRGRASVPPCENDSSSDSFADKTGGEDAEESVRIPNGEERETDSNFDTFFPCEEENATQTAHRDCSAESSTRGGGGPKEEELVVCREQRTGQGNEREERGNGASESGKNVCHLTNLFTSRPEVVWNFDQNPTQPRPPQYAQVQSDKRLHVYLEETSVIHCGKDLSVGQEVVTTTLKKDLHIIPKAKSPSSLATNAEIDLRSAAGAHSSDSTLVGVSVKPPEDSQSEPQPDKEQTKADDMGRKHSGRKRSRRKSQGDGGSRLSEKPAEEVPQSCNSMSSPQSESPTSHTGEECEGPSFKTNPTSQAAPEGGGQIETVCPGDVKQLGNLRNSISVTAATTACEENKGAEMEEESSLYKVERKTETPESKRRSIKVSTCEVKNYSIVLPLNQKQNQLENHQEPNAERLTTKDEEKNQEDSRPHDPNKVAKDPKPGAGGIADKISIFERQRRLDAAQIQTPRSADVSPIRKLTNRFKADLIFSEQRSKSAERPREGRSGFSSPSREKPMTVKERTRKFMEASNLEAEPAPKQVAAKAATPQKSTSKVFTGLTKSLEPDGQDKLDVKEQMPANSGITPDPQGGGSDANDVQVGVSEVQLADSSTKETEDQVTMQNSISKSEESASLTNSTTSTPKGPTRTGSRSKKKNREPASPVSIQNTSEGPATEQEHAGDAESTPPSKQTAEKVAFPSQKLLGDFSEKQPHTDSRDEERVFDVLPNRQEGSPEPTGHRDEPDTPVCSSGTKNTIDSDPAVSPPEEGLSGEHSFAFEAKRNNIDNSQTSASSSSGEQLPAVKQESLAEQPSLGQELSARLESASKEESGQTTKGQIKEPTFQSQPENVEVLEPADREKANNAERVFPAKTMAALSSDTSLTKDMSSHSGGVPSEKERNVQEAQESETACHLSEETPAPPFQTQRPSQVETEHREKAVICTMSDTNDAVSSAGADKKPPNIKMASNVPQESLTQSAESPGMERETVVVAVEPQFNSVSVEKPENSLDDSCTHEANAPEPSNSKPSIKAAAAASADEGRSSKVTNELPELIDSLKYKTGKESSTKEHSSKPSCEPANSHAGEENGDRSATNNSETPQDKVAGEIIKAVFSNVSGKSENTEDKSNISTIKILKNADQRSFEGKALYSKVCESEKTAGTASTPPMQELSPFPNGNVSSHLQLQEDNKKLKNQTPKTSAKTNNLNPDSIHRLAMKKLQVPLGLKTDSTEGKETPSSWLDLDFPKPKPKVQVAKLTSSGSESNLLDTSGEFDDDDFVAKIKNLCVPFSHPPRKHHPIRSPQPPFVMPAIKEATLEKTFDPEEFMFSLRKKKKQLSLDVTPSPLADLHSTETKSNILPARASFAERSLLLSGFRDVKPLKDEDVKEDRDDQIRVKSRLEGSSLYSSLISSNLRGNKNGLQAESSASEELLPSQAPLVSPSPPPCPANATKDTLTKQITEEVQASEDIVSDSSPPLPSFNDIKLPDYLKKYLPQDSATAVQSAHGQEEEKTEFTEKMAAPVSRPKTDLVSTPNLGLPDSVASCFPGIPPTTLSTLPDLKQPVTQPHKTSANGFHKRPGKMVLFENAQFSGQAYEIYRDVAHASSLQFSPLISVKVVRGCWLLYERPDFQGRIIALEEGATDLENEWAECEPETELQDRPPMLIGSIRLVVRDHSIPHIDLFTDPEGRGRVTSYHDDTIETGTFGIPLTTASLQIHSGVWLVFSDPGFQGMLSVLEAGEYPFPETWGFPSPFVGSLRPLKMGGLKVENPSEIKAVLFEKPGFEGSSLEIDSEVFSFSDNNEAIPLKSVGSLKIIGGFWVGYSQPGFEGQQHILEEGEYDDCREWGGSELLSLRPVLSDFLSPHVKLFSDRDFGELGVNINLTSPVGSIDETGYGMKTQSVDVTSGVWVFFDEPEFCGECYVLEKGMYGSPEDWGALQPRVGSAMPVLLALEVPVWSPDFGKKNIQALTDEKYATRVCGVLTSLDDFVNISKFKVQLFSDPGFQGSVLTLEDSAASLQDGFSVASCKVQAGSWVAFEGQDFTGKMYALEVGSYPDLRAMGCVSKSSSIQSLQSVGPEFSLPSITLFERCGLRGKRVLLTDGTVNLLLAGGSTRVQSVLVEGGMWVVYEGINYRGAQILLKPGEIPNWHKFSSWQKIGSLRPLLQKHVYFRLRNRQSGLIMSITGDFDDIKMLRIQETEETGGFEQIWLYQNGHLYCKLFEEYCLSPSGSVTIPGSRLGVASKFDDQIHQWSITPEGFVRYTLIPDLVLEVKGGHQYDKKHVILNTLDPHKLQQRWDVEIL